MKTACSVFSVLAVAAVLVGCSEKKETPPAQTSGGAGSVVTAPVDYLNAAANAKHAAEKTIDVTALNAALQQFNVGEGRYPTDLNELVTKKYISQIPTPPTGSKLQYDANSGQVTIVKQ